MAENTKKKFSPDGDKLLCFNERDVIVVYFNIDKALAKESAGVESIMSAEEPVIDVFWYPGSNYIMVISEKDIKVVELREGVFNRNIVSIYKFNSRPQGVYYDDGAGILYFTDKKPDAVSEEDRFLYKLELKDNFFENMIRMLVKKEADEGYEKR